MRQAFMLPHLDLRASHEHAVDVLGIKYSRGIPVLSRFSDEAHRDRARDGAHHGVGKTIVVSAIHDRVDALRLDIEPRDSTVYEIFQRREVHRRVDRIHRILPHRRIRHVGVVTVGNRIGPQIVEASSE